MTKTERLLAALRRELDDDYTYSTSETVSGTNWQFTKRDDTIPTLFLYHDTKHQDGRHSLIITHPKTHFVLHVLDGTRRPISLSGRPTQEIVAAMAYAMEEGPQS